MLLHLFASWTTSNFSLVSKKWYFKNLLTKPQKLMKHQLCARKSTEYRDRKINVIAPVLQEVLSLIRTDSCINEWVQECWRWCERRLHWIPWCRWRRGWSYLILLEIEAERGERLLEGVMLRQNLKRWIEVCLRQSLLSYQIFVHLSAKNTKL